MTLHLIDETDRQFFMCRERADERFAAVTTNSRHTCYYCQLANELRAQRLIDARRQSTTTSARG